MTGHHRGRHTLLAWVLAVLALGALADGQTAAGASAAPTTDPFRGAGVVRIEPPRPAPALSANLGGGQSATLPSLRGRPVMVWFFASW
jgi:hypothetical protein